MRQAKRGDAARRDARAVRALGRTARPVALTEYANDCSTSSPAGPVRAPVPGPVLASVTARLARPCPRDRGTGAIAEEARIPFPARLPARETAIVGRGAPCDSV